MRTVSPECVLQTTLRTGDENSMFTWYNQPFPTSLHANKSVWSPPGRVISKTPVKEPVIMGKNKRKQYTPMRSPFHDVTNYQHEESPEKNMGFNPLVIEEPKPKRARVDNEPTLGKFARESPGRPSV